MAGAIFADSKRPSFSARFTKCISVEVALLNITTRVHASTNRLFASRRISLLKPSLKHVERRISFVLHFCKVFTDLPLAGLRTAK